MNYRRKSKASPTADQMQPRGARRTVWPMSARARYGDIVRQSTTSFRILYTVYLLYTALLLCYDVLLYI